LDPTRNCLFTTEYLNNVVRKVDLATQNVTTIAGIDKIGYRDGPADQAQFFYLEGIIVTKEGDLIVADSSNHLLRKIILSGTGTPTVITIAGQPHSSGTVDGQALTKALLNEPCGLAMDKVGNLIITERRGLIRKLFSSGSELFTIRSDYLNRPEGVALDEEGNIYVANSNDHNIVKIGYSGTASILAGFNPTSITLETQIYVSGYKHGYVDGLSSVTKFNFPNAIAIAPDGNIFVTDQQNNVIRIIYHAAEMHNFILENTSLHQDLKNIINNGSITPQQVTRVTGKQFTLHCDILSTRCPSLLQVN